MNGVVEVGTRETPCAGTRTRRFAVACLVILWIGMGQLLGCSSSREYIPIEIRETRPMLKKTVPEADRLKVAVAPFEDRRADTSLVGFRQNWLGRKIPITIERGHVGTIVAEVLVGDGTHRRGWEAWLAKPGVLEPEEGPDFTLKGKILTFEANASPSLGGTYLTVSVRMEIAITGRQAAARDPLVAVAEGMESRRVFWFEQKDLEGLVNETIRKAMDRFTTQMAIKTEVGIRNDK